MFGLLAILFPVMIVNVFVLQVGFDPMTGVMMSTQQDNREVAEGHSLAEDGHGLHHHARS